MTDQDQQYAPTKNYYAGASDSVSGLRFRVDPQIEIRRVVDTFAGVSRDKYGREIGKAKFPMMNEEGVRNARGWLEGTVTKMTHLTKYLNEERIMRQVRYYIGVWIYNVTRYKKLWGIKNTRAVIAEVEKLITESMFRGHEGFEANLTAKSFQVQELHTSREDTSGGRGGFLGTGLFRGRKNNQEEGF